MPASPAGRSLAAAKNGLISRAITRYPAPVRLLRAITNGWAMLRLVCFGFPCTHEARRCGRQGARDDIRALIAPILRQIEGGETAPDIRNARTLLAELV